MSSADSPPVEGEAQLRRPTLPVIAVVGRPNAGKSTLFNRLTRSQKAQVDPQPGVTRDRNFAEARHQGRRYIVVDTGGIDLEADEGIVAEIRAQSEVAIAEADGVIFLLDGRAGVSPADREVIDQLRRSRKPFWVAVNKLDTPRLDDDAADFFALGVDNVLPISAAHGRGVEELLDLVLANIAEPEPTGDAAGAAIAVAIVGRPNVGKSSLLNRLVGFERSIVTPLAGTTRDAVDTPVQRAGRDYVLIDTAGIRRRPRVEKQLERGSVTRALRALERADVGVLVIDAIEGMTDQDARLAGHAWEKGRALVLVVNKCDLLEDKRRAQDHLESEIRRLYPFLDAVPLLFTSAQTGDGAKRLLPLVNRVSDANRLQVSTVALNQVLRRATEQTPPPSLRGHRPTFKYATQTAIRPPTLALFCSRPDQIPESYTRFLTNRLREQFPLSGTPIRIQYRQSSVDRKPRGKSPGKRRPAGKARKR